MLYSIACEYAIRAMTSDYGSERCLQVAKQTGDDRKYLNFFGEPEEGKPFAWRIAAHATPSWHR